MFVVKKQQHKKGERMKRRVLLLLTGLVLLNTSVNVQAKELVKGRATVYSDVGKTKMGTDTRYGICATGDEDLLGKYVILYQRLPDNSKGECLGIFHVEDTGCKKEVIDIWCPIKLQQKIKDRTYENGCEGKVYIEEVDNG